MTKHTTEAGMLAEQIAAKLTAAQREALLNGQCSAPRGNQEWTPECICGADFQARRDIKALGLVFARERFPGGMVRTELGLQVRAILQGNQP